jgi:hypothetical protein
MRLRFVCCAATLLLTSAPLARAATDATLFRLFLRDGTSVVSFGEFARLDDQVVFSMPVGGAADEPRLHVTSLPAAAIDWTRTDRYAASARSQHYAATRGEEDFQLLSNDVARVLNDVAYSNDKQTALATAERARGTLANWPATHYGYRQRDVNEIVALLDEAISDLRASNGRNDFAVSLVATPEETGYEPLLAMPSISEEIDATFRVAKQTSRVSERVALLQEVLVMVKDAGTTISDADALRWQRLAEGQIHDESVLDARYTALSRKLLTAASSAAAQARVSDVQKTLAQVSKEDAKLGGLRPDVIQALNASLQAQLDNAQRLRLLRDQWQIRRAAYREYQRAIGGQLLQLVKMQPSLDEIRRLDGPAPTMLVTLRSRLGGGAARLEHLHVPDELRATHELLVSAWRFAETAVDTRYTAVSSGNVTTAWQASSSAAGALLMVAKVQKDIRALLEPPRLQ